MPINNTNPLNLDAYELCDGKLKLTEASMKLLEALPEVREKQKRAEEGKLPCGCEYARKFNGGDPRFFCTEHCERHREVSLGIAPKMFDPEMATALLEANLRLHKASVNMAKLVGA